MRILFVVPYTPNLIRTRSYNLIRELARRQHEITLITLWETEEEKEYLTTLRRICHEVIAFRQTKLRVLWNLLTTIPSKDPLQASYSWQPALVKELKRLLARVDSPAFDVIHIEHLRASRYVMALEKMNRGPSPHSDHSSLLSGVPLVWDSVDCISYLFRQTSLHGKSMASRSIARFELKRTKEIEGKLTDSVDQTLVTSEVDKQELFALSSRKRHSAITVLQNGVDSDYFRPDSSVPRDPLMLVVSGKMSYHANVSMVLFLAHEIMPQLWQAEPRVILTIVGMNPPRKIRALGDHPSIRVTGTVPDVRPFLQGAAVAVAPLQYGAGIQNKILEAMACSTPVVTTPLAVRSLHLTDGQGLRIAEKPDQFAGIVLDLLNDEPERERLGFAGREYVRNKHSWSDIAGSLEEAYVGVVRA